MQAALSCLKPRGIWVLPKSDDWLLCAPKKEQAIQDTDTLLAHIVMLYIMVNSEKSSLTLEQATQFIGVKLVSLRILAQV